MRRLKAGLVLLHGVWQSGMDQEGTKGIFAVAAFLIHGVNVNAQQDAMSALCFLNHRQKSPYCLPPLSLLLSPLMSLVSV